MKKARVTNRGNVGHITSQDLYEVRASCCSHITLVSFRNPGLRTSVYLDKQAGRSPLHWACTRGNTAVAVALLDAGADGLARDGAGKTPLHCAAQVGHTPIVQALLDSYAFASAPQGLQAATAVRAAMVANPAAAGTASSTSNVAMQQHDEGLVSIVDARNAYGSTALHRAAFNGREGAILTLLRGGAGVSVVGRSGR